MRIGFHVGKIEISMTYEEYQNLPAEKKEVLKKHFFYEQKKWISKKGVTKELDQQTNLKNLKEILEVLAKLFPEVQATENKELTSTKPFRINLQNSYGPFLKIDQKEDEEIAIKFMKFISCEIKDNGYFLIITPKKGLLGLAI